jgi:hypothetical protein
MQLDGVLIHRRRSLSTAIAFGVVEAPGTNGMLTERAFEGDTAVHPIRCVVAHKFIVDHFGS